MRRAAYYGVMDKMLGLLHAKLNHHCDAAKQESLSQGTDLPFLIFAGGFRYSLFDGTTMKRTMFLRIMLLICLSLEDYSYFMDTY